MAVSGINRNRSPADPGSGHDSSQVGAFQKSVVGQKRDKTPDGHKKGNGSEPAPNRAPPPLTKGYKPAPKGTQAPPLYSVQSMKLGSGHIYLEYTYHDKYEGDPDAGNVTLKLDVTKARNPEMYAKLLADARQASAHLKSEGENHDGLITYRGYQGVKYTVDKSSQPKIYCDVLAVRGSVAQGYKEALGQTPPQLADIKSIGAPEHGISGGIVRYTTNDGGKYVVSQDANPLAYAAVEAYSKQMGSLHEAEKQGYKLATKDGNAPAYGDIKSYAKITPNPGLVEYTDNNGHKVIVSKYQTPMLYQQVLAESNIAFHQWPGINKAQKQGYDVVGPNANVPLAEDIKKYDTSTPGVISYVTPQGKYVVSKAATPEAYAGIAGAVAAKKAIDQATKQGYTYVGSGYDFNAKPGSVKDLGHGIIAFEADTPGDHVIDKNDDGKKFVVSQDANPVLYGKLLQQVSSGKGGIDDQLDALRKKYGLPSEDKFNPLLQNAPGSKDSVSDSALLKLYNNYSKELQNGTIGKESLQAKFVYALQAQSIAANGYNLLPYQQADADYSDYGNPTKLTPADMQQIVDPNKAAAAFEKLMNNPAISSDYRKQVISELGGASKVKAEAASMYKVLTSAAYAKFLQAANTPALKEAAQTQMQADLSSLNLLDPQLGKKATVALTLNAMAADVAKGLSHPGSLSLQDLKDNAGVTFNMINGLFASGTYASRAMISSWATISQLKNRSAIMAALAKLPVPDSGVYSSGQLGKITEGLHGNAINALSKLNKFGILGTASAIDQFLSAGENAAGKGGASSHAAVKPYQSTEQKVAIAYHVILGASDAPAAYGLFKSVVGGASTVWGDALKVLGMQDTALGQDVENHKLSAKPDPRTDHADTTLEEWQRLLSRMKSPPPVVQKLANTPEDLEGDRIGPAGPTEEEMKGLTSQVNKILTADSGGVKIEGPGVAERIAQGLGDVLSVGAGTLSMVLSGIDIQHATTGWQKAVDGLGIANGALFTLSGIAGGTGTILSAAGAIEASGAVAAGLSLASTGLSLGAAILGGVAIGIELGIQHDENDQARNAQSDFFDTLANNNLLAPDWANKLEYARYMLYAYGGRDTPNYDSIFNYQSAEYTHFASLPLGYMGPKDLYGPPDPDYGSSARLSPHLHRHYDATEGPITAGEIPSPAGIPWDHIK